jgi:hypothetical protein
MGTDPAKSARDYRGAFSTRPPLSVTDWGRNPLNPLLKSVDSLIPA